jgi:flagellar biosynthesis/type III secretory pathway protein FliH
LASISELSIVEDNSLSPGGIKIETEAGTIDATVDSQAKELEKALLEKYNRNNQS